MPAPFAGTPPANDHTPPSAPGAPVVSNINANQTATVTVTPATDNVAVAGYAAFLDGSPFEHARGATPTMQLSGVPEGSHTVVVRAFDAAGNYSSPSIGATFTIPVPDYTDIYQFDTHPLTRLHRKIATGETLRLLHSGDSTIENRAGANLIPYVPSIVVGGTTVLQYAPDLPLNLLTRNCGLNGAASTVLLGAALTNAGGNRVDAAGIAAYHDDGGIFSWGINNARNNASIAGTAVRSAAKIALAQEIRSNVLAAVAACVAVNPDFVAIFVTPNRFINAAATTNNLLQNGVTDQDCQDVFRLCYNGVPGTSLPEPITASYPDRSILIDTDYVLFSQRTVTADRMISSDGLHPNNFPGYRFLEAVALSELSDVRPAPATNLEDIKNNALTRLLYTPAISNSLADIVNSGLFDEVATGVIHDAGTTFVDILLQAVALSNAARLVLYGTPDSPFSYGSTQEPAVAPGDLIYIDSAVGAADYAFILQRPPDGIQGNGVRFFNGAPDGVSYNNFTQYIRSAKIRIFRHRYAYNIFAYQYFSASSIYSAYNADSGINVYPFYIVSQSGHTLTIQGMAGSFGLSLAGHTMSASDQLFLTGVDNNFNGVSLASATFGTSTRFGSKTITLAGANFANFNANMRQGIILSPT
ncbi:MAG: hypothetical protein CTY18_02925 [Methylomonas sp.]|nr:MAG: hypothetical protein CTY18_02925 [Methylomonas sp.]